MNTPPRAKDAARAALINLISSIPTAALHVEMPSNPLNKPVVMPHMVPSSAAWYVQQAVSKTNALVLHNETE